MKNSPIGTSEFLQHTGDFTIPEISFEKESVGATAAAVIDAHDGLISFASLLFALTPDADKIKYTNEPMQMPASSAMPILSLIVAVDDNNGIGKCGTIPWKIPKDMKHFKKITCAGGDTDGDTGAINAVIMGRLTWESIGKPLQHRLNIIITKNTHLQTPSHVLKFTNINDAIDVCKTLNIYKIFAIGGSAIYKEFLSNRWCDELYITRVNGVFNCDTFFPYDINCNGDCNGDCNGTTYALEYDEIHSECRFQKYIKLNRNIKN